MSRTFILVLLLLTALAPGFSSFSISVSVSPAVVTVGSPANLTCNIDMGWNGQSRDQSIFWSFKNENNDVSENCKPYNDRQYSVWQNHANCFIATQHVLTIKQVQWSQRGYWYCKYASNSSNVFLNVTIPAQMERFTGGPVSPAKRLRGNGSLLAPFDLTTSSGSGQGLRLSCRSSCSFPASRPRIRALAGVRLAPRGWRAAVATNSSSGGGCRLGQRALAVESE
uniref:Ig-like domain-containing protein n=1 Tax=Macrostomum lignano TaxID=282301 RepID=A0A1I8ICH4_9PLAT